MYNQHTMKDNFVRDDGSGDGRWAAVVNRDAALSEDFRFGVTTTGIYCRPGCPSPAPKREHVHFFPDWEAAEAAGFRPCKRCDPRAAHPDEDWADLVARACRLIETADREPALKDLAAHVHLSPSHFHRVFKKITGITPKAYAAQVRAGRVRSNLKKGTSVTRALSDAGYVFPGNFYEGSARTLGMRPTEFRKGGAGLIIRYAFHTTYLGQTLIAATEKGVCMIAFADTDEELLENLKHTFPNAKLAGDDQDFIEFSGQAVAFIESPGEHFPLPLDIQGTAFQRRVWDTLMELQPGETAVYSEIARGIGKPKATRAVASACAANKLAVAVPCHRVKRKDGGLGGYRWGLERKQKLLDREAKE